MLPQCLVDGQERCDGKRLGDLRTDVGHGAKVDEVESEGSLGKASSSESKRSMMECTPGSTLT